ncbi:hypothetical protein [Chamaesiphon sp. VAR_48_metabat_403]|uniref:hypothetical protein n=1 Tax=Chamaesiphon sp. VAR_48_metabat_403 TaxID=2964700 RepID=UPI00286E7D29|nr:hypothetical protein [Chamaesiphon sp. VAR_48_metabat_403]
MNIDRLMFRSSIMSLALSASIDRLEASIIKRKVACPQQSNSIVTSSVFTSIAYSTLRERI